MLCAVLKSNDARECVALKVQRYSIESSQTSSITFFYYFFYDSAFGALRRRVVEEFRAKPGHPSSTLDPACCCQHKLQKKNSQDFVWLLTCRNHCTVHMQMVSQQRSAAALVDHRRCSGGMHMCDLCSSGIRTVQPWS